MTIIGLLRMSDTSWEEEPSKVLFNGMPVSRSVDPPSFDSKYKFWSERILSRQAQARESCFSVSDCRKFASYQGLQPLCLIPVIVCFIFYMLSLFLTVI